MEISIRGRRLRDVIVCRTHKVLLRKHLDCFRGKEIVDYLLNQSVIQSEHEAVSICAQMLAERVFVRVVTVAMPATERAVFSKGGLYRWDAEERPTSPSKREREREIEREVGIARCSGHC